LSESEADLHSMLSTVLSRAGWFVLRRRFALQDLSVLRLSSF
jgi:hypothetical protein